MIMISNRLPRAGWQLLVLLTLVFIARAALAQPGGRPGGGHGGRPGGEHGGRPGGGPGGGHFGGPEDLLGRLDANGNGMIDPNESQGRARYFLQRVMPDADFSRPIPIEQLKRSFEKARAQRSGPPGGPHESGGRGGPDQAGGPSSSQQHDASEPLTPGFGNEFNMIPVPGFDGGSPDDVLQVKISEEDRRRADYYFQRYDANRDKSLTRDEAQHSRRLGDPRADSNGDGRLTADELAAYFARQRVQEQRNESSRSGGDSREREGDRGPYSPRSREDKGHRNATASDTGSDGRKSYRFLAAEERLPEGLPEWFRERDADHDGQIAMAEFSSRWTDALAAKFSAFDGNQDGIVTPEECLAADSGEVTVTAGETDRKPATSRSESTSAPEADAPSVDPSYQRYAQGIIRKYDKNGDGVLASDEWSEMSKSPEPADTDRDGRITVAEYAVWLMKK